MKGLIIHFILLKIKILKFTSPRLLCYDLKNNQFFSFYNKYTGKNNYTLLT